MGKFLYDGLGQTEGLASNDWSTAGSDITCFEGTHAAFFVF